jgi:hypothetical protein
LPGVKRAAGDSPLPLAQAFTRQMLDWRVPSAVVQLPRIAPADRKI